MANFLIDKWKTNDFEFQSSFGVDPFRKGNHRLSNISDVSTDSGVIGPESIPDAPPSPSSSIFSQTSLFGGSEVSALAMIT